MPTINPSLVPTINPGSLFDRFTSDTELSVRYYVPSDPVHSSTLNRPLGDLAVRQLILSKTLDNLSLRLGHQSLFPYLVQPQVFNGTQNIDVPLSWIWDMNVSLPQKWEKVRLAKLKRISGTNPGTDETDYTGRIRLVFTGQAQGSSVETALFQVDYIINSELTYQEGTRVSIPSASEESPVVSSGESETIGGFITFKTMDTSDSAVQSFLDTVEPPLDTTAVDSSGFYTSPTVIQINDSPSGGAGVTGDFDFQAISHGTGLLTLNAWNPIPALDSDVSTWISTFNYPFGVDATLISSGSVGVTIPTGLFKEFSITAPAGDQPTGDTSGDFSPVWVNRIVRMDDSADTLKFWFSTFNISSVPSLVPVEFASLTLERTMESGDVISIVPEEALFPDFVSDSEWSQDFGKGHVVLSSTWGDTSFTIDNFFDSFLPIIDEPAQAIFSQDETRLSSFGVDRVPQYTPTAGQAAALRGSLASIATPQHPDSSNRYVVEGDQGLGDQVNFNTVAGLSDSIRNNADIEQYGYTGSLVHRVVKLVVNSSGTSHDYETDILPRLRILFGRDPVFGDQWYDGIKFKTFNGDAWIG